MKRDDLTKKTDAALSELLREKREAIRLFRFATAGSRAKNVKEGLVARKTIARVLTEQAARKSSSR